MKLKIQIVLLLLLVNTIISTVANFNHPLIESTIFGAIVGWEIDNIVDFLEKLTNKRNRK